MEYHQLYLHLFNEEYNEHQMVFDTLDNPSYECKLLNIIADFELGHNTRAINNFYQLSTNTSHSLRELILNNYFILLSNFYNDELMEEIIKDGYVLIKKLLKHIETVDEPWDKDSSSILCIAYNNLLGEFFSSKGRLIVALTYLEKSKLLVDKLDNNKLKAIVNIKIGNVYMAKGDYQIAKYFYLETLELLPDNDFYRSILQLNYNLAFTYFFENDFNRAAEILVETNELNVEEYKDNNLLIQGYFFLFMIFNQSTRNEDARYYLKLIDNIQTKGKLIELTKKLSKAIHLKSKRRYTTRVEGQIILRNLLNSEIINFTLTIIATTNCIDLLIEEYTKTNEKGAIEEIQQLLGLINVYAKQNQSNTLRIKLLIFQAKLSLLTHGPKLASGYLEKAKILSTVIGVEKYLLQIEDVESQIKAIEYLEAEQSTDDLLYYLSEIGPVVSHTN